MITESQLFNRVVSMTKQLSPEYRLKLIEVLTQTLWEFVPSSASSKSQPADWPVDFFEQTAGAWKGAPLQRSDQGDFEIRAELQ